MAAGAEQRQSEGASGQVVSARAGAGFKPRITWFAGVASAVAVALTAAVLASWAVVTIWSEPKNPTAGLQLVHLDSTAAVPATTMTVTITFGSVDMALEAVRDRTDPATQNLTSGSDTLSGFARYSFDNLKINGQSAANDLRAAPVKISATSSRAVLQATAHRAGPLLLGAGTIEFERELKTDPSRRTPFDLVVNVRDYRILGVTSEDRTGNALLPSELDQGRVVWNDSAPDSDWKDIKVNVAYDPLAHPLAMLRRSPFDLVLPPWSLGLGLLSAVLLAIPTIWALWLLPGAGGRGAGTTFELDAGRALRGLLALSLAGSVLGLSLALAGPVAARAASAVDHTVGGGLMSPPPSTDMDSAASTLPWATAVTTAFLALVLAGAVIVRLRLRPCHPDHRGWTAMPGEVLVSLVLAAVLALVAEIGSWAVFYLPRLHFAFTVPAAAIGATILVLPLAWAARLYARWPSQVVVADDQAPEADQEGQRHDEHDGQRGGMPWTLLICGILAALLAIPANPVGYDVQVSKPDQAFRAAAVFVPYLQSLNLTSYVVAFVIILVLADRPQVERATRSRWAALLFAAYIVGLRASVLIVPLAFLVALFVFQHLVVVGDEDQKQLDRNRPKVIKKERRRELLKAALEEGKPANDKEAKPANAEESHLRKVVLAFGPRPERWDNAANAMRAALLLVIPLLLPSLLGFLSGAIGEDQPYFPLSLVDQMIAVVGYFVVGAFFFGYFFTYLRGSSGLTKGLFVSLGAILCLTPVWLVTTSSPQDVAAVLLRCGQVVIFFSALGAWFDYQTFSDMLKEDFNLRQFLNFRGLGNVTAASSVLIASVGVTLTTVFTGQVASVTSAVLRLVVPQLPVPPDAGPH